MIGHSLGRMDISYVLTTFPFIRGSLASHVCSSIQIPYNIVNVAQIDGIMRINGEQACDGIWDVMSTNNVVDFVREELNQGKGPELVAKDLTAKCLGLGSRDNMTALIVSLAAAPQSVVTISSTRTAHSIDISTRGRCAHALTLKTNRFRVKTKRILWSRTLTLSRCRRRSFSAERSWRTFSAT